MASIKLKHSGGNGVIIAAPTSNPASDKTLTLPSDVDGTVVSKDSSNSLQNIAGINGGQLGNRNLIINGAFQVAQRGTSSTVSGYGSVDRFSVYYSNTDEAPTQAQADVASGTTPYTLGFRKSFKVTNGNQTSGAGADDQFAMRTRLEAQDIANCGWNYTSASSFITLSFWVKSSVAQNFYGRLRTQETNYNYAFETGSLSADTWTKVTKKIAGNSNLQFDNDNAKGLTIEWVLFRGTDHTSSIALDTWLAYSNGTKVPDMTSTWYTTNDATFEITGVQLEVGDTATDFEHRSFGQELALCQRYFQKSFNYDTVPAVSIDKCVYIFVRPYTSNYVEAIGNDYVTEMRAQPTVVLYPTQGSGSVGQISYYSSGWSNATGNYHSSSATTKRLTLGVVATSGTTLVQYNYTADAEL